MQGWWGTSRVTCQGWEWRPSSRPRSPPALPWWEKECLPGIPSRDATEHFSASSLVGKGRPSPTPKSPLLLHCTLQKGLQADPQLPAQLATGNSQAQGTARHGAGVILAPLLCGTPIHPAIWGQRAPFAPHQDTTTHFLPL